MEQKMTLKVKGEEVSVQLKEKKGLLGDQKRLIQEKEKKQMHQLKGSTKKYKDYPHSEYLFSVILLFFLDFGSSLDRNIRNVTSPSLTSRRAKVEEEI